MKNIENKTIEELAEARHSKNIFEAHEEGLSFGERLADKLADFAGSWTFIIIFISVLLTWIVVNSVLLFGYAFDQYPFILLNLVLSCIAAMQAPVIMMSQNRQENRDRLRAEHDYEVNLKSEILIEEVLKRLDVIEKKQEDILQTLQRKSGITQKNPENEYEINHQI
ncbi:MULTISPECIES: DUF1003 domain-containing protein [unclassified Dehalobacter]|uniref:DUF1003 domain-containing protein n=1 Tax=unclassified Dehalobacter TaxID=2635733 RepID=UPI00028B5C97|nr:MULTISPECIES: DUF1003 domain-containing protein [unclassified Dehalobacter]AFV01977.1 hypothetical protein DHBDCA_p950 [Dehalobacter sp. DCA]AFV05013.1 hypothetical protein DCF50_p1008 [Dehalobacter sp. CF]